MMVRRPLVAVGQKTTNQICDSSKLKDTVNVNAVFY